MLIQRMLKRHGKYGLPEVYVRCLNKNYKRSFVSMCRQIRMNNMKLATKNKMKKSYTKYNNFIAKFVGEKVQIDIKYVPVECTLFPSYVKK